MFILYDEPATFNNDWWIYTILGVLILIMLIVPAIPTIIRKIKWHKDKKETYTKRKTINDTLENEKYKLVYDKQVILEDPFTYNDKSSYCPKMHILISENSKEITLIDYQLGTINKCKFNQIKQIDIVEDFGSQSSGRFFGSSNNNNTTNYGGNNSWGNSFGVSSGSYSTNIYNTCNHLSLLITTKNKNCPQIEYHIINNFPGTIKTNSQTYQHLKRQLTEFIAYFDIIKEQ